MVVQVPGVVANFVDMRSDDFCQSIVLLQIDGKIGGRLLANVGQRGGVFLAVDGNSHDIGPGVLHQVNQRDRGFYVRRLRGGHQLDRDRMVVANGNRADADRPRFLALNINHSLSSFEVVGCMSLFHFSSVELGIPTTEIERFLPE